MLELKSPIIYYTKEDGHNKFLYTSNNGTNCEGAKSKEGLSQASKILGHEVHNLYAFINGTEFKLL